MSTLLKYVATELECFGSECLKECGQDKSISCAQEGYWGWNRVKNWPLKENKKAWRRIYKSLLLLDYLGKFCDVLGYL